MTDRELKFQQLLRSSGVTKCYVGDGFSFNDPYPNGTIFIDKKDNKLFLELYKLFTEDKDGIIGEDQSLIIWRNDFSTLEPNYPLHL